MLLSHVLLNWLLALICAVLTFFLFKFLVPDDSHLVFNVRSKLACLPKRYWFLSLFLLGLAVLLVPDMSYVYRAWGDISFLLWARLIGSFVFTAFLPGFTLLKIADKNGDILNSLGRTIVFSYLLSIFFTSLIGFVICLIGASIEVYGTTALLVFNFVLILIQQLFENKRKMNLNKCNGSNNRVWSVDKYSLFKFAILSIIVVFWLVNGLNIQLEKELGGNLLNRGADESFHNFSLMYMEGFPFWQFYVYWHHIFTAVFFALSGIPTVNAFVCGEIIFGAIPILAFYVMASTFFDKKSKIPVVATVFASFFQGFGWIYANPLFSFISNDTTVSARFGSLWNAGYKTYDIYMGTQFFSSTYSTLFLVGLPVFMILVCLLRSEKPDGPLKYLLVAILVAEGYLGHVVEVPFFISLFLLFILFNFKFIKNPKLFSFSMLLGLCLVGLIDLLSPVKYYVHSVTSHPVGSWLTLSNVFVMQFLLILGTTLFFTINERLPFRKLIGGFLSKIKTLAEIIHTFSLKLTLNPMHYKKICSSMLVFVYGFCFLIWWANLSEIGELRFGVEYMSIPIYVLPIRLGIVGALALATTIYLIHQRNAHKHLRVFFVWAIFFVVLGRVMWALGIYSDEARSTTFLFFSLAIISSSFVVHLFSKINRYSRVLKTSVSIFLILTVVGGFCSTIVYTELFSLSYLNTLDISPKEVEAFDYLKNNAPINSVVLGLSTRSVIALSAYAGQSNPMAWPRWSEESQWKIVTESNNPESLFSLLDKFNVDYVYATREEYVTNNALFGKLLQFLPVAFNNSDVTVFEVPSTSSFDVNSNLTLITPAILNLNSFVDNNEMEVRFEELNSTAIIEDGHTSFWRVSGSGTGNISLPTIIDDDKKRTNGSNSMKIIVGNGFYAQWELSSIFSTIQDWSSNDFISLYWNGANSGKELRLAFFDPTGGKYFFVGFFDSFIGWKHLVFPKYAFNEINSPSWGEIGMVYIYGLDNAQGIWNLDHLTVSNGFFQSGQLNVSLINDCDTTMGWGGLDLATKVDESTGRQYLQSHSEEKSNSESRITLFFSNPQDFTDFDFLSFDITCSSSDMQYYEASLIDVDGNTHQSFWRLDYDVAGAWKRIILPLSQPDGNYGENADLSQISLMQIKVCEPSSALNPTYCVDNIVAIKDTNYYNLSQAYFNAVSLVSTGLIPYSVSLENEIFDFNQSSMLLPFDPDPSKISPYSEWVEDGGQLIVLNSLNHGLFAKELSIISGEKAIVNTIETADSKTEFPHLSIDKTWSEDKNVQTAAFYGLDGLTVSPFAFKKQVGLGEIVYVEVSSYFSNLNAQKGTEKGRDYFSSLGDLMSILNVSTPVSSSKVQDSVYDYQHGEKQWSSYVYSSINCSGQVQLTSDSISILNDCGVYVNLLSVTSKVSNISLSEITLDSLALYGPLDATLASTKVSVYSNGFGPYIYVLFEGKTNLTLTLHETAKIDINISNENGSSVSIPEKSTVFLSGIQSDLGLTFLVRSPTFFVDGQTFIDEPYFWPQSPRSWGESLNITGISSFQVDFGEKNLLWLSDFLVDGGVTRGQTYMFASEVSKYSGYRSEVEDILFTLSSHPLLVILYALGVLIPSIIWLHHKQRPESEVLHVS